MSYKFIHNQSILKNRKLLTIIVFLLFGLFFHVNSRAQLTVIEGAGLGMNPIQLVNNVLVGNGVTVSNGKFNGSTGYITSNMIGSFDAVGGAQTQLGFSGGIILTSGQASLAIGPNNSESDGASTSTGSDPDLQALVPSYSVNDKAVLEFDFVPIADTIKFQYVFGSEEFDEYCNTSYNDVFGFFVSGPGISGPFSNGAINIARMPNNPNNYVTINNVCNAGATYSWSNSGGVFFEYDRLTKVYTAMALVQPCQQYHIKLAVGDCGDGVYDSGVFLKENSFSAYGVTVSTSFAIPGTGENAVEGCSDGYLCFKLSTPATSPYTVPMTISGTATNGVDYTFIPNDITFATGQDSITVIIHPLVDGISEGTETVIFNVQTIICGGNSNIPISIIDNSPVSLVSSNDTLICGDPATIWVNASGGFPPYNYNWDNGIGNVSSATINPPASTIYYVTVTDLCSSSATESIAITVGSLTADAGPDVTICAGDVANLNAVGGTGYLWNTGQGTPSISVQPAVTTTYYCTIYNVCDAVDSVTVFVNPLPTITATANPMSIYDGESTVLCGSGGVSYSWISNPMDVSLSGQNTLPCPVVSPGETTNYMVVGTDANGCQNSANVTVIVIPIYPVVDFEAYPVAGCEPLTVQFTDLSSRVKPGATYVWDFGNNTFSYEEDPIAYYTDPGTYDVTLTITNPGNYTTTLVKPGYIVVYPKPVAIFSSSPQNFTTILDPTFSFFDNSLGNITQWYWDFGDGYNSIAQNNTHCYYYGDIYYNFPQMEDTGTYLVTLVVTSNHGCVDTTSQYVRIIPTHAIYVPNAFTPNDDPKNQYFCAQGYGIIEEGFRMRIYDRWGKQVFESQSITDCWNGEYNDSPVETGTYVYIIEYLDSKYIKHKTKGTVTLFH
ncbi:MAG: choice-of-anchor L domain-containing protein [Bacteroidales bacterium]